MTLHQTKNIWRWPSHRINSTYNITSVKHVKERLTKRKVFKTVPFKHETPEPLQRPHRSRHDFKKGWNVRVTDVRHANRSSWLLRAFFLMTLNQLTSSWKLKWILPSQMSLKSHRLENFFLQIIHLTTGFLDC